MTIETFLDLEIVDRAAFLEAVIQRCPSRCVLEVEGRFSKSVLRALERFDRKRCRVGRQTLSPFGCVRSYRIDDTSRQLLSIWVVVGPGKMQWNILIRPSSSNRHVVAALAFIHNEWWNYS